MSLQDYAKRLGYTMTEDEGGRQQYYLGDRRLRNSEDVGGQLSGLQPFYDQYQAGMWGSEPYAGANDSLDQLSAQTFQGPDGRYYIRTGANTPWDDQMREVGGRPGDVINDPRYGGGIEVGLANRVAARFRQDGWGEKIMNNMPIILGTIFAGAAAAGALGGAGGVAAGAGEGAAVGAGAGASSGAGAAAGTMSPELAAWFSAAGYTPAEVAAIQSGIAAGAGAGAGAVLPESYWSTIADSGAVTSDAAATGAGTVQSGSTLSAADIAGLQQMGIDAGLGGSSLDTFVASGGQLGSTTAGGGGGIGSGFIDANSITQPGFTTNPSLNSLGGGQPGLLPDWMQAIVDKMPPGSGTAAEKAYKYVTDNPEKAASLGMSAANAARGNDTSAIDSSLALSQQDEAGRGALRNQISSIFDSGNYAESDARVGDATRQYQTAELKKRYDEQERQLRFGAARSGNTLGSVATTGQQNLQESNRMGGVAIDDAVRRAIASLQSGRETTKQNALGLVNSGAGPEAVQSASQQIQALTDQAAQGDKSDLFSGLFANTATFSPSGSAQNPLSAYAAAIRNKGGITAAQPTNKPNVFATG